MSDSTWISSCAVDSHQPTPLEWWRDLSHQPRPPYTSAIGTIDKTFHRCVKTPHGVTLLSYTAR